MNEAGDIEVAASAAQASGCASLDGRLRALAEQGAAAFDPDGFRLAERLVAAGLGARARLRIDKLERELHETQRCVDHALAALVTRGAASGPVLEGLRACGDHRAAMRLIARLERRFSSSEGSTTSRWALTLAERARTRAVRLPDELAFRVDRLTRSPSSAPDAQASDVAHAISRVMFADSVASSRATVAIARATDNVPADAGPYNPQAIAARVLAELAVCSPAYAQAFVSGLDDLASLDCLPVPAKGRPSSRRRR